MKVVCGIIGACLMLLGLAMGRYVFPEIGIPSVFVEPYTPSDVNDGMGFVKQLADGGLCGHVFIHDDKVNVYAGSNCHDTGVSGTGKSLPEAVADIRTKSALLATVLAAPQ